MFVLRIGGVMFCCVVQCIWTVHLCSRYASTDTCTHVCLLLGLIHQISSTSRVNTSFTRALVFSLTTVSSYLTDRSPFLTQPWHVNL